MKFSEVRRAIALIHQAQQQDSVSLFELPKLLMVQLGIDEDEVDEAIRMAMNEEYICVGDSPTVIVFKI